MIKIKLVLSLLFIVLVGCSRGYETAESFGYAKEAMYEESSDASIGGSDQIIERKIIKEGDITFKVKDLDKSKASIIDLIKSLNGYISSDREYKSSNRITNSLTVRIPNENFEDFFKKLSQNAEYIDNKNINFSDVTEEFIDVETRLRNKKALENRFIEILKDANSVSEILEVEREIGAIREDIEATEGRLNYLKSRITLSTIYVNMYQEIQGEYKENPVVKSLKNGWSYFIGFLLLLLNIWPLIILIGVTIPLIRKIRKNKGRRK